VRPTCTTATYVFTARVLTAVCVIADTTPPVVSLLGDTNLTVEGTAASNTYVDAGATATDLFEGSLTPSLSHDVDMHRLGVYQAVWAAVDASGNAGQATRRVEVVDTTPPSVTVTPSANVTLEAVQDAPYTENATTAASDAVFGNVSVVFTTNVDASVPGVYWSRWDAQDASGNVATARRFVHVVDTLAPVLSMTTAVTVSVEAHQSVPYTDTGGVSANDLVDGAVAVQMVRGQLLLACLLLLLSCLALVLSCLVLSCLVLHRSACQMGMVNRTEPGNYTLTFVASDAANNTGSIERKVTVVDTTPPVLTLSGGSEFVLEEGETWTDVFQATDNGDGDITGLVQVVWSPHEPNSTTKAVGSNFTAVYTVADRAGHQVQATRVVAVTGTCVVSRCML